MKPKIHRIFRTLEGKTYGLTIAYTTNQEDGSYLVGMAFCDPRDQPNRKLGNTIATGRYYSAPFHFDGNLDIAEGKMDNLETTIMQYFLKFISETTKSTRISIEDTTRFPRWIEEFVTAWQWEKLKNLTIN